MSDPEDAKQADLEQEWDWLTNIEIMQTNLHTAHNMLDAGGNLKQVREYMEFVERMAGNLQREMKARLERDAKNEN